MAYDVSKERWYVETSAISTKLVPLKQLKMTNTSHTVACIVPPNAIMNTEDMIWAMHQMRSMMKERLNESAS